MGDALAGVVLAAGAGTRLAPLTRWRPKALCPIAGVPLVDPALARLRPHAGAVAVNLHHGARALDAHLADDVHRSPEPGEALGTAGALGRLRSWIDGRDVLLTNADAWFADGLDLSSFVSGWDRERVRLLCVRRDGAGDFGDLRYCGVALLPWASVAPLPAAPAGLYEVSWRAERAADRLELVEVAWPFVDCGTPQDYLAANLLATTGAGFTDPAAVVGDGAQVVRSVVWDGAEVRPGEVLERTIRTAHGSVLVR